LAKAGDSIPGFAVVGSAKEWLGDDGTRDVHEFFVLREFRRSRVGQQMSTYIWNKYPGAWLVRVLEANAPALAFWRAAIAGYAHGRQKEESRRVHGRPWVFFRFTSPGSAPPLV
jgi:predicted acetyltransferase